MKKAFMVLLSVLMIVFCFSACGNSEHKTTADDTNTPNGNTSDSTPAPTVEKYGIHHAEIVIKDYGTIKLELDGDTAPITVENFVTLAKSGFYDGLTFHRIAENFMMQGGAPNGNGSGGSGKNIKGEFIANGVQNNISHKRGVISMARSNSYDSASSQFFICQQYKAHLDGQYAAFGHVTEGLDVVDKICEEAEPIDSNYLIAKDKQPVIEKIIITD